MHVFYTLAICATPSLGGCTVDTWLRAETDAAATDAALAACIAYERENAQCSSRSPAGLVAEMHGTFFGCLFRFLKAFENQRRNERRKNRTAYDLLKST